MARSQDPAEFKRRNPGEVVVRREVWQGRVWSGLPMFVVADQPDLLALYLPSGSEFGFGSGIWPTPNGKHPWDRGPDSKWRGHGVVHLHRPGDAHAVWVFWQGPERNCLGWYLNLQEPFTRTALGIDTLDHELDIVAKLDLSWSFKDAELMDSCIELGRFTIEEVERIKAEGDRLGQSLDNGEQWWDPAWSTWTPPLNMSAPASLPDGWDAGESLAEPGLA